MVKRNKIFANKPPQILVVVVITLLVLLFVLSLYKYFFSNKTNEYLIGNKYYGFELKTPKTWVAEGKIFLYSEDNIAQILSGCENDKSNGAPAYEIGRFRFQNQNYPQGFGEAGYFPLGFPSGAILDVAINCIPDSMKDKVIYYNYSSLKIAGEKSFSEFLNLLGFGQTKYFSFFHNNFQYNISEYVYVSPFDKSKNEEGIRENYAKVFDGIISSFNFTPIK